MRAEQGVTWELVAGTDVDALRNPTSGPIGEENRWWRALTAGLAAAGVRYDPQIFPAATDSRFLRSAGVPCFGFSPMRHTPVLLHDHDERLALPEFLRGIEGAGQRAVVSACRDDVHAGVSHALVLFSLRCATGAPGRADDGGVVVVHRAAVVVRVGEGACVWRVPAPWARLPASVRLCSTRLCYSPNNVFGSGSRCSMW